MLWRSRLLPQGSVLVSWLAACYCKGTRPIQYVAASWLVDGAFDMRTRALRSRPSAGGRVRNKRFGQGIDDFYEEWRLSEPKLDYGAHLVCYRMFHGDGDRRHLLVGSTQVAGKIRSTSPRWASRRCPWNADRSACPRPSGRRWCWTGPRPSATSGCWQQKAKRFLTRFCSLSPLAGGRALEGRGRLAPAMGVADNSSDNLTAHRPSGEQLYP
jgi:hypothetical protein